MDKGFASNFTFDLARVWLEAFNEEDWEKFKAQLHPEITFTQRAIGSVNQTVNEVFTSFHDWRALYSMPACTVTSPMGLETSIAPYWKSIGPEQNWTAKLQIFTPVCCSKCKMKS